MKKLYQLFWKICKLFHINVNNNKKLELKTEKELTYEILYEEITLDSNAIKKFKDIKSGDIIYAKRIDSRDPSKVLDKGHKSGPFLVLENKGDKLLCCYGSSNCEKYSMQNKLIVDNKNYNTLTKPTCFFITNITEITLEIFNKRIDTLNNIDKHIFRKKINILAIKNKFFKKYIKNLNLEQGDIFKYQKELYLIYKLENNIITAIGVSNSTLTDYKFASNNGINYIDFSNVIKISNNNYVAHDFVTKDVYNNILLKLKKYFEQEKMKNIIQRGSIVKFKEELMYIYSQVGENFLGYKIYQLSDDDKFPITINHIKYSANFDDIYILNKNDSYEVISISSVDEADNNKKIKKLYNKSKVNLLKLKRKYKENIKEGVIVTDRTFMHTEYIVLQRNGNELLAIMLDSYKIYFQYLNVHEIDFNRDLNIEEFRDILINLSKRQNKYIANMQLDLLIDKYSK